MRRIEQLVMFACTMAAGCAGGVISNTGDEAAAISTTVMTGSFHVEATTSDGYAIVSDLKAKTVNSVQLATKKATVLLTSPLVAPRTSWTAIGPTILLWHDATTNGAQLSAFNSQSGIHQLSSNASTKPGTWHVSADGQHIVFLEHVDASTDQIVLDGPAHATPIVLTRTSSACNSVARWTDSDFTRVIAGFCPAGSTTRQVVVFNVVTNATTTLQSGGPDVWFALDPMGVRATVHPSSGTAIVSLDGSASDLIDAGQVWGNFFPDGVEFAFTANGALKRVAAGGKPETIVQTGANGLDWISSDGAWAFFFNQADANDVGDKKAANLYVDGPPVVVDANASGALEASSADNKRSLFYVNVDSTRTTGVFESLTLASGVATRLGANGSLVDGDYEMPNDRVIFNDNYVAATATAPAKLNVESINYSASAPAVQLLAAGADPGFLPTPDGTMVVYTTSDPTTGGLYMVAVP